MNRKLLVIIALIAIALIVAYRSQGWKFDWALFFSSFKNVHLGWLFASILATIATYFLRAVRWKVLLKPVKQIHMDSLLSATLLGFSAIFILGRPAEVVRPVWLSRREQLPFSASVSTIVVERLLDFVMLVIMFGIAVLYADFPATAHAAGPVEMMKTTAWILLAVSVAGIAAMFIFRSNIDRITPRIPFKRVASLVHNFAQGLSFLEEGSSLRVTVFHSATLWVVIALQFWFMMLGMRFDFSFLAATLVMVFVAIGSIAQVPGIGGGFQAGFVFCLGTFFAVSPEKAVAASLIAWVFSYAPTILIAAIYMLYSGLSLRDLRGLETT